MTDKLICVDCGTTFKEGERHACVARDPLLVEREKTHGSFRDQGASAAADKERNRTTPNWANLTGAQQEALDLIETKKSRILYGDPKHKDSWLDLAGYAKLGAEACE